MQFIARLHTPRTDANTLQATVYGANEDILGSLALVTLANEPVGAWVEVIERVEITRREYRKELDANGKEIIRTVVCTAPGSAGPQSSSQIDAGKERGK